MASKQASLTTDLIECPVCLDDMMNKSPKLLECKHSFCMSCLSGLAVKHGTSDLKVPCPKCNHETVVNSGQLSDLTDNFLLQQVKSVLGAHSRHYYCFYCSKLDKTERAISQCITCYRFMCNDCSEKHKETPRFMKHEIIVVNREKKQEHCQTHNEPVVYVCLACSPNRLICDVCIMLDASCHSDKDLVDYNTLLSKEESKLKSKIDQQPNVDKVLSEMEEKRLQQIIKARDNVAFIKKGIESALEDVSREIEESMSFTSLKLASDWVENSKAIALERLKDDTKRLEGIRKADRELSKAFDKFTEEEKKAKEKSFHLDDDSQIWRELMNIKQNIDRMCKEGRPNLLSCWSIHGVVINLKATRDGRVLYVCQRSPVITEICKEGETRQVMTKHLGYDREVTSADICDDQMYIVCCHTPFSALYKCELSSHKETLCTLSDQNRMITYHGDVTELCACDANSIIFAWSDGSLCKTDETDKLDTPYKDDQVQLTRFNTNDQLRFIATYVTHQTVLLHDTEGKTLQTINKDGSPVKQPRASTVSAQNNILIADSGTCKIVELTVEGTFVRNVLTEEDGLQNPINVEYSPPYRWVADQTKDKETVLKCFM